MNFDAVSITKDLIRIDSTDPGSYEEHIFKYIKEYLNKLPCSNIEIKEEEVISGRKNFMASIGADITGPALVFMCHMDTVPVGNGWTYPPMGAVEENGRIYGRGACDMKSGLACALTAFSRAAVKVDQGEAMFRCLRFIATVDEEDEMLGAIKAVKSGWISKDDYIIDTEPTSCRIKSGHKGRQWFKLTILGKAAHASEPWEGADAIVGMSEAISYISSHFNELPKDEYFGDSTVCFGQISGGTVPYAVSDSCSVTIDMRLVPPATIEDAKSLIDRAIEYAGLKVNGISGTYKVTGDKPSIPYYKNSELLKAMKKSCCEVLASEEEISPFTGYTDSAVVSGMLGNSNCLSFGPGDLKDAHKPDEFVIIREIVNCKTIFDMLISDLCFIKGYGYIK